MSFKTIAEAMAIAVLKGDMVAALGLADQLKEDSQEADRIKSGMVKEIGRNGGAFDGYAVWRWPEFQALMRRLGLDTTGKSVSLSFTIREGERVLLVHEVAGDDLGPNLGPIDTTTMRNRQMRTAEMPVPHDEEVD